MNVTVNDLRTFQESKHHTISVFITAACLIAISAVALGGNLLVLAAIAINRNLRSLSDLFVANLALADLCQACVAVPLRVVNLFGSEHAPIIPCHAVVLFSVLFGGASNFSILLVSVDKFIAIKWPFKYNNWTTVKLLICTIVLSWLSLIIYSVLPVIGWGKAAAADFSSTCRFMDTLDKHYVATAYLFIHGIPLTTIIFIYLFILKATFRHSREIAAQELSLRTNNFPISNAASITNEEMSTNGDREQKQSGRNQRRHLRACAQPSRRGKGVRMVAVLVGLFIILVLPIIVIDVLEIWKEPFVPLAVVYVAICLIYANSAVNVFIYAGWSSEYKRTFRGLLSSFWELVLRPCS